MGYCIYFDINFLRLIKVAERQARERREYEEKMKRCREQTNTAGVASRIIHMKLESKADTLATC